VGDVSPLHSHTYCAHERTLRVYVLGVGTAVKCLSCDEEVLEPDSPTVIGRAKIRERKRDDDDDGAG
jgi:hypothetical protein